MTVECRSSAETIDSPKVTAPKAGVPRQSIVVDGDRIEVPTRSTCITCKSPHRVEIEALRAHGNSYRAIMEALPEDAAVRRSWDGTSLVSVQHFTNRVAAHMRSHAAFDKAVTARILDGYAEQHGIDVTEAVDTLLTVPGHLQAIMQRAHENVVNGAPVSPRDGIAAAKALIDFEAKHQTEEIDVAYFASVIDRLTEIIEEFLTPEDRRWFHRACEGDDVVREGIALIRAKQHAAAAAAS